MTSKINIDVDVDQAAFLSFYSAFQEYKKGLDECPGQWGKAAEGIGKASDNALTLYERATGVEGALERASRYGSALKNASDATARAWGSLSRHTRDVAGHIKEATGSLLKWSGVAGVVGGLTGFGGMIGVDALGSHVAGGRTAAMRAGTTYGGREALGINFGRMGNTDGVLNRVAGIMSSADHTALRNLGITEEEIRNGDPADIAAKAFAKLREKSKGVNKAFLGDWMRSNRIDEVFDFGQALQARETSDDEMKGMQEGFRRDRPRLEMTPAAQLGWTKFVMQLDAAAGIVHKVFAENLSHFTKGLGALSDSFSKVLAALFKKDGPLAQWLDGLGKWLGKLADDIGKPDFQAWLGKLFDGVKTLAQWTGRLLEGLAKVAKWLGVSTASASTFDGGLRGGDETQQGGKSVGDPTSDFFDAIIKAEGTGKHGDPYNASLGYLKSPKPLTEMTMAEALAWGDHIRKGTDIGRRFNSSAKGAFQIVNTTQRLAMDGLHLGPDDKFSVENQRRMAAWIARKQGLGAWEGFKSHPDQRARAAAALERRSEDARDLEERRPTSAAPVDDYPQTWRTRVTITKPPGGDAALSANALAHS